MTSRIRRVRRVRRVRRALWPRPAAAVAGLTALIVAGAAGVAAARSSIRAAARQPATSALDQVSITRDDAGIAHIRAKNFGLLGIGEGYAFAQDNLCTFADDVVTLNGQRSQYFGPSGQAINYSAATHETNLESDLWWRYVNASGIVQRELSAPPPNGPLPQVAPAVHPLHAGLQRLRALRQVARSELQGQAVGAPDHAARRRPRGDARRLAQRMCAGQ